MKLFTVTKRTLDFGIGDAPPVWCTTVRAKNKAAVEKLLKKHGPHYLVSIREYVPKSLPEFETFLKARPENDGHHAKVTPEEVAGMLGHGRWWDCP